MSARWKRRAAFGADTGGAIAILTALVLPVLIGIAAYAIDASLLLYRQERLQLATDIGAMGGARLLADGDTEDRVTAMAAALVIANVGENAGAVPTVEVTLPEPGRLVVAARLPVQRYFSQLFGRGALDVQANSVVLIDAQPSAACIHLDGSGNKALTLDRASSLTLTNCAIDIAASRPISADVKRRARLTTECLTMAGRINGASRVQSDCPGLRENATVPGPEPIPLAPTPEVGCADWASGKSGGKGGGPAPARLTPGAPIQFGLPQICLSKMKVERDTVGDPGIYFIDDELEIQDGATLTLGPGAVIVLLDKAEIDMDDAARLVVTAPDSGPLEGMAILPGRGRGDPSRRAHDLGRIEITGRIALPGEAIAIAGQGTAVRCTRLRAGSLALGRAAAVAIACAAPVGGAGATVRLAPDP